MALLSTVIISYNEEAKIARCIQSALEVSEEVILLDSHSTDNTVIIAQQLGAKVHTQSFKGFILQREDSIMLASHDLVLALDADEYLGPKLISAIHEIKSTRTADVYQLNRLSGINGHWIRHGSWHPDPIVRLFHKSHVSNGGEAPHDKIIPHKGSQVIKLAGLLYHDAHDSIEDRRLAITKHSLVAAQTKYAKGIRSHLLKQLLKTIWKFIVEYFFKLGFLDGYYGWIAAKSTAQYIYLREGHLIRMERIDGY